MKESPDDWVVDQPKGEDGKWELYGIKHKSTNFQFHLPKNAIPDKVKVEGKEPTPTVEKETKESESEKKPKKSIQTLHGEFIGKHANCFQHYPHTNRTEKGNPPATNKQRLSLDGVMEPSVHVLKKAFGFPRKGDVLGKFKVMDVKIERKAPCETQDLRLPLADRLQG